MAISPSGTREEIPQLRKANIPRDTEEIVRPTVPEAQHDYEIHRRLSHSHVYKAKTDTPDMLLKSANQNRSNPQGLKSANQHADVNEHERGVANQSRHADEAYESTNQSTGTLSYSSNGNYSANSSDSLYAASSIGAESNYSMRHGLKDAIEAKAEADNMYPVYETVEPQSDLPVAMEPDTFSNPPDPVFDQSDEVLQNDQSESIAAANEALNFLEELDTSQNDQILENEDSETDYRGAPSPRSDISASSAATTRYGSYDVNLDISESSGKVTGYNSTENSIDRRNPPQFIPPPPPVEPPPSDSDTCSPRDSERSPRSMSGTSPRTSETSPRGFHDQQFSDSDRETPLKTVQPHHSSLPSLDNTEGVNSLRAAKRTPRTSLQPSLGLSIAPAFEDYSLDDLNANIAPPPSFKDESPTKDKPFAPETFDFLNNYTQETLGFPVRCTTPTRHKDADTTSSFLHRNRDITSALNHPKPNQNQFHRAAASRDRSTVAVEVQPEEVSEFFEPTEHVPAGAVKVQVPKAVKSLGE